MKVNSVCNSYTVIGENVNICHFCAPLTQMRLLTYLLKYSCRSGPAISQLAVVSRVIVGGLGPQIATHHVDLCSDELLLNSDELSWRRVRTVHIAAKTDFKFDGNQTRNFDIVLRKVIAGRHVERRTVCSYKVRQHFQSSVILLPFYYYY